MSMNMYQETPFIKYEALSGSCSGVTEGERSFGNENKYQIELITLGIL